MFCLGVARRSEPRRSFLKAMEFVVETDDENLLRGSVVNISVSGLGLYSFTPLNVGDQVVIAKRVHPAQHRKYAVQWVKEMIDGFFLIGLRCENKRMTR